MHKQKLTLMAQTLTPTKSTLRINTKGKHKYKPVEGFKYWLMLIPERLIELEHLRIIRNEIERFNNLCKEGKPVIILLKYPNNIDLYFEQPINLSGNTCFYMYDYGLYFQYMPFDLIKAESAVIL